MLKNFHFSEHFKFLYRIMISRINLSFKGMQKSRGVRFGERAYRASWPRFPIQLFHVVESNSQLCWDAPYYWNQMFTTSWSAKFSELWSTWFCLISLRLLAIHKNKTIIYLQFLNIHIKFYWYCNSKKYFSRLENVKTIYSYMKWKTKNLIRPAFGYLFLDIG